jgi:hypothetical protein
MRGVIAIVPLIVFAALPATARAQDKARVATVALTGVMAKPEPNRDVTADRKAVRERGRTRHAAKPAAKGKVKLSKGGAVPRFTFEQRAARSFGPLSLTLPPETHLDRNGAQFYHADRATAANSAADRNQLAGAPDDAASDRITSAGIENLGLGHNLTVMVPLFHIPDKLPDQSAPSPEQ